MPDSFSENHFDDIVRKCYKLMQKINVKSDNVFKEFHDIVYNSDKNYVHYYPTTLFFQLTSGCNLRCKHCFFADKPQRYVTENDLTEEQVFEQLKYFTDEVNILFCTLTGGEIFTSPFLMDVVKYLKQKSVILKLITNGTLINEENAKELSKLLNPKFDIIQVSLDGATRETNDKIRGVGVFDKAISSIKHLVNNNCNVEIGYTVNSQNVKEISEIYNLACNLKVKSLNLGKFSLECENQEYLVPKIDDIFLNVSKLADIYTENVKLLIPCIKTPDFLRYEIGRKLLDKELEKGINIPQDLHCKTHHQQVALFANGNLSLCYNCSEDDLIIGNLKEKSFEEIWKNRFNSPMFQKRNIENHMCKNCKYIGICLSGCPYKAWKKYRTISASGFDCEYLKTLGE